MELKSYIINRLMELDGVKTKKIDFEINLDSTGKVREHPTGNVVRFTVDTSGQLQTIKSQAIPPIKLTKPLTEKQTKKLIKMEEEEKRNG